MNLADKANILLIIASVSGLLSIYYFFTLTLKLKKLKFVAASTRLITFLVLASLSGFLSLLLLGTQGYNALTKEKLVASVQITPVAKQKFRLQLNLVNGPSRLFLLRGDELLIDAHILKWKAWTNILGLHTGYRLDRVSGRYKHIEQAQTAERTVYQIDSLTSSGIADWRESYSKLSFLLDVEHGSASFVDASENSQFDLFVTTDGLLLRPSDSTIH